MMAKERGNGISRRNTGAGLTGGLGAKNDENGAKRLGFFPNLGAGDFVLANWGVPHLGGNAGLPLWLNSWLIVW